jgi:hypothetical protein
MNTAQHRRWIELAMNTAQVPRWIRGRYRLGERGGSHEIYRAATVRDGNQVVMRLFAYGHDITVTTPIESAENLSAVLWATYKYKHHSPSPAPLRSAEASLFPAAPGAETMKLARLPTLSLNSPPPRPRRVVGAMP